MELKGDSVLILLEGGDCSGKSTLAKAIASRWLAKLADGSASSPASLIHKGPPDPPDRCPYQEYEGYLDGNAARLMDSGELTIFDRWHAGEQPYGTLLRGKSRLGDAGMLHIEMALSSLGAEKVICSPPLSVVRQYFAERGDDLVRASQLPAIHAWYASHAARYGYMVRSTDEGQEQFISELLESAARKSTRARQAAKATAGTYTGSLTPSCIVAGDQLGGDPETAGDPRRAFSRPFTPSTSFTSGEWLMSAICKAGLYGNLGLVNVNHPGVDMPWLAKVVFPDARWVALGANASKELKSHGIQHTRVAHPSWAKRFRHDSHDEYAAELKAAAGVAGG
jgi:hypothetical protein